jgi:hypothetical protein
MYAMRTFIFRTPMSVTEWSEANRAAGHALHHQSFRLGIIHRGAEMANLAPTYVGKNDK